MDTAPLESRTYEPCMCIVQMCILD